MPDNKDIHTSLGSSRDIPVTSGEDEEMNLLSRATRNDTLAPEDDTKQRRLAAMAARQMGASHEEVDFILGVEEPPDQESYVVDCYWCGKTFDAGTTHPGTRPDCGAHPPLPDVTPPPRKYNFSGLTDKLKQVDPEKFDPAVKTAKIERVIEQLKEEDVDVSNSDHREVVMREAMGLRLIAESIAVFEFDPKLVFITEYGRAALTIARFDMESVAALLRVKASDLENSCK